MVRLSLSALAVLASSSLITALPAKPVAVEQFSYEKWVDGIIADPNGNHLSPEEAVKARMASVAAHPGSLSTRATCRADGEMKPANAEDAVACINYLASLGGQICRAKVVTRFCTIGNAAITGVASGGVSEAEDTCEHVARAAGKIMDKCTRADKSVNGQELSWGQEKMAVHIHHPSDG
ncbi:hypothetical protein ACJ41O_013050 [Fusarium nematophilum]